MPPNDPWADFEDVSDAPPVASGTPGRINVGGPPPIKPNLPAGYQMNGGVATRIPGLPPEKGNDPEKERLDNIAHDLQADSVLAAVRRARKQIGTGDATGNVQGRGFYQMIPWAGQDSANLAATLSGIQGSVINDMIQQLKSLSSTGASGYGSLSEQEADRLAASVAALQQTQSADELTTSLANVEKHYRAAKALLNGEDPRLPEVAARYGISRDVANGGGSPDPSIKGIRLTPEQEAAWTTLISRNPPPSPGEIQQFFKDNGVGVANAEEVTGSLQRGAKPRAGIDYSQVDADARARAEAELAAQDKFSGGEGAADTVGQTGMSLGLRDQAAGIGRGASYLLQGKNPVEGYTLGRDAELLRAEKARERLGWMATPIEVGGALLSANPNALVAPITTRAGTIVQGMKAGAYGGGLSGFGYGEGTEGSVTNALLGAGAGALVGGGISALASRGGGGPPQSRLEGPAIRAAAERQGVDINAANVRPGARSMFGYLESSPGSAGPTQRNMAAQAQRLEERAGTLTMGGTALDPNAAGSSVANAGVRTLDRYKTQAKRYFDGAAQKAGNLSLTSDGAIQRIQQRIASLKGTPKTNEARISVLEDILSDLTMPDGSPRPLSVDSLREIRSGVGVQLRNKGLTATKAEADASEALNAVSDDLAAGLQAHSPEAARLYKLGDRIWRERADLRRNVLDRLIGPDGNRPAEKVFQSVQAMASNRGDFAGMSKIMRMMSPAERRDIAASVANLAGKKGEGEPFSPAEFIGWARGLSKNARQLVFGRDGAETIGDLELLSRTYRDVTRKLNNSRSGQVSNYRAFFGQMFGIGGLGASVGALVGGPAGGAGGAGAGMAIGATVNAAGLAARRITAEMMLFKPFVRWLARAPRSNNPQAIQAHIRQLAGLGRGTPIASDMQGFQQMLQRQFVGPTTASEPDQNSGQ